MKKFTARLVFVLTLVVMMVLVPSALLNISGMEHVHAATFDLATWGVGLALILGCYASFLYAWRKLGWR